MAAVKLSSFAPGEVHIYIDGERLPGPTRVAVGWDPRQMPWVSISTDPDDDTYRTPPGESPDSFAAEDRK